MQNMNDFMDYNPASFSSTSVTHFSLTTYRKGKSELVF